MYLISPDSKQYKANIHCHSNCSDGKKPPEELKEMYKSHGYSILAITDHETPKKHTELSDKDFLVLTGYEAYIRPFHCYDRYKEEVHLNLISRTPDNETLIDYDPRYIHYISHEEAAKKALDGKQVEREYSVEYVNSFIKKAKENGYIVTYNHPHWSMESEETILGYEGCFSMEMCNYSSYTIDRLEYNSHIYEQMLLKEKRIACHGADDNHNGHSEDSCGWDSYGAYAMVMAKSLDYDSVIEALEKGEMYCSMGPEIKSLSVEGDKVHVECSKAKQIVLHNGSKSSPRAYAAKDGYITSADFTIEKEAKFIRITVIDENSNMADTRGYFRDEFEG